LVGYIEDKFAAHRAPEGRALMGMSSGGYGALTLGMRHPDVFGHVLSHSGDVAFEACYAADMLKLCVAVEKHGGSLERLVADFRRSRAKPGFSHDTNNPLG